MLCLQSQLAELRQAQQAWEAERQALLADVEEERGRLQEGLAQALTQATCAQVRAMLCDCCRWRLVGSQPVQSH